MMRLIHWNMDTFTVNLIHKHETTNINFNEKEKHHNKIFK